MDPNDPAGLVSPETLDDLADTAGTALLGRTLRALAESWRATQRDLAFAQTENSMLEAQLNKYRTSMVGLANQAPA